MNKKKMDILCPHFTLCSGCSHNISVDELPLIQEARSFVAAKGIISFLINVGMPSEWRYRAKLAVRGTKENPLIGLFEKGSHRAVDIPECRVHHPAINKAAALCRKWIQDNSLEPYNEETGTGELRYVQMTVERQTGRVQLVFVFNEYREGIAKDLWDYDRELWHSFWLNENQRRDNVIFGESWSLLYGEEWLWDTFCGRQVCFHPASFFQANPAMFELLLKRIQETVPAGSSIVEYYAGAGVIGLALVNKAESIQCVEIVPLAERCFSKSRELLPPHEREKISFLRGTSATHKHLIMPPTNVVIVDPPRKGLEPELLKALGETTTLEMLVYVSCGWNGFKKDCEALLKAGWKLKMAEVFLFFPGSDHIEVLAIFT